MGTALLLIGCNGNGWESIDENEAFKIRDVILNKVETPDYVSMTKKYSRVETYGGSTKKYEYEGPRLEISKKDFYIKNVIYQAEEWDPRTEERPYYVLFTEYHVIEHVIKESQDYWEVWLLKDVGGVRSKSGTRFETEEEAKERMLTYMKNDIIFTLSVDFSYDVTIVDKVIELSKEDPEHYKGEIAFKTKKSDEMSLSCDYSYTQPGETVAIDALRASVSRKWENGYETYEKGHYEGIDYDAVGYKYDYVEDAEYKGEYNKPITIDPVDPNTWLDE